MSGIRSKNSRIKLLISFLAMACFFVYANVSAGPKNHQAEVAILADSSLTAELVSDINKAQKSVYIAIYMFKSYASTTSGAGMIVDALKKAADRGLDVYVAFESSDDGDFVEKENKNTGKQLAERGVTVVYDSPDNRMHSKCAVIDEHISYVGSHNYTNSALKHNREITARIVSAETAAKVLSHIRSVK
ncbi:MAG: phospholipase D-like domain-containing protein [Deferribacterales bacterium]